MKILFAEDDTETAAYVVNGLSGEGHVVDHLTNGKDALAQAMSGDYDLLVLDRMMPGLDGLSVLKSLRAAKVETPAILLTAMGAVDDRVAGLRGGADDYMVKPFAFVELLARIDTILRRPALRDEVLEHVIGDLRLDLLTREVTRDGQKIELQPREFLLLKHFMERPGRVQTRTVLLESVWGLHFDPKTNVIDVHVSNLRNKIDRGEDQALIHTVRGVGYRLGPDRD